VFPSYRVENMSAPKDFDCYRSFDKFYESMCGPFDDYSNKYSKYLAHACDTEPIEEILMQQTMMASICNGVI
jgi:hypothetical protein